MNNLKSELIPNNYSNYSNPQYFSNESNQSRQQYSDPYNHNKNPVHNAAYGYNPYQQSQQISYEPTQPQAHVSSSSPAYPLQPTPSPSPKQCNKCGYVCESAFQLIQHVNVAHPPMSAPHLLVFQPNQHFMFNQPNIIKHEDPTQSKILDLDSHKDIHTVFPEDEIRLSDNPNGRNPGSMSALLNSWSPLQQQTIQPQRKLQEHFEYQQEQERIFINDQGFVVSGVTTTTQENDRYGINPLGQPSHAYRSFEHLPSSPNAPVTSSSRDSSNYSQAAPSTVHKSSNWKSNEARRPKKYKCAVCSSLFTILGHLKRHYNTTVHKNAVKKSSGQTSPTASSINSHNHPDRDNPTKQDDCSKSRSSADEIRNEDNNTMPSQFEKLNAMPLLQQSNEPYYQQPGPNIHHTALHSPMPQQTNPLGSHLDNPSLSNLSNGNPPNGEADLSTNNIDSRGPLSLCSSPINPVNTPHGFNMASENMTSMENNLFQMYPNGSTLHVTQAMAVNSLTTTGEIQVTNQNSLAEENQPLPSFAQLQAYRCGLIGYADRLHPDRDNPAKQDDCSKSRSSADEIRNEDNNTMPSQFEKLNAMPLLQQSNEPYDRQPGPNIHHPALYSPMPQQPNPLASHLDNPSLSNLSNGNPSNWEADISINNIDSRGPLSLCSSPINPVNIPHGFNMASEHMTSMENHQFQMYPNGSTLHVTQAMAVNSLTTTGEIQITNQNSLAEENQPLPSFAQIQAYGNLGIANVGSGFTATDYPSQDDYVIQYLPNHNNVNHEHGMLTMGSKEAIKLEEKVHITPDDKENTDSPQISSTATTKSNVIECRDCDKKFAKACYLTQHNTTYHSGDKPFKCTKCGKRFSCEMIFKEHFTKHAGDKPHKCDFCPKQFNHKTDLRRHMCLHTGQKPYACDTCGKGFIRKDHMMKHCETHLKKSNGKMAGIR